MNSGARFLQTLQNLQAQGNDSADLSDWVLGTVIGVNPLTIQLEQKDIVTEEFLELTDAVRDHHVDIEVAHITEKRAGGSGYPAYEAHDHDYLHRKKIIIWNGLKVGETVIMLRQAGGQSFVVLSRNHDHIGLSGQWILNEIDLE